jgi:hypothetical protein
MSATTKLAAKIKAIAACHHLVAGLEIRQGLVENQIEKNIDQAIAEIVMVIRRAVRAAVEARAINHVRNLAHRDEIEHLRPVGGIVFEIASWITSRSPEIAAKAVCSAPPLPLLRSWKIGGIDTLGGVGPAAKTRLPLWSRSTIDPPRGPRGKLASSHSRVPSVERSSTTNDLLTHLRQASRHLRQDGAERPALVVNGDDDRQEHSRVARRMITFQVDHPPFFDSVIADRLMASSPARSARGMTRGQNSI